MIKNKCDCINNYLRTDVDNIGRLFAGRPKKDKSGSRVKSSSKSKRAASDEVSVAVGGKDASLFLFRALGKVLYCKREYQ